MIFLKLNAFFKAVARANKGFPEVSILTPQLRGCRLVWAPEEKDKKKGSRTGECAGKLEFLLLQPGSWEDGVVTTTPLLHLRVIASSHTFPQWPWRKSSSYSSSPTLHQSQSQQPSQVFYLPSAGCCFGKVPALSVPKGALAWVWG